MSGRRQFGFIRKRNNGLYQATYTVRGKNHSLGVFRTKGRASAELAAVQASLQSGTWIDPSLGQVTFDIYADTWLKNRISLRPRSKDQYASLIKNHLTPAFGSERINQISAHQVRTWNASLQATASGTAPAAYRLLRAIFSTAVEDGLVLRSPCRVRGAGSDLAKVRPLPTVAEIQKLAEAMPPNLQAAIWLAAGGTLRRGEVLGLQRRDIDLVEGTVHVERALVEPSDGSLTYGPTKNGASRTVHLSSDVLLVVQSHLEGSVGPEDDAPLFTGTTGRPVRPGAFWRAWDKARNVTGITEYRFHDLRHFAATDFSSTGASMGEVMARGGWKSPAMVSRYQHATPQRDAELAKSLPRLVPLEPASDVEQVASGNFETPGQRPTCSDRPVRSTEIHSDQGKSSGGETRTLNLAVNSRSLCRLSYPGPLSRSGFPDTACQRTLAADLRTFGGLATFRAGRRCGPPGQRCKTVRMGSQWSGEVSDRHRCRLRARLHAWDQSRTGAVQPDREGDGPGHPFGTGLRIHRHGRRQGQGGRHPERGAGQRRRQLPTRVA